MTFDKEFITTIITIVTATIVVTRKMATKDDLVKLQMATKADLTKFETTTKTDFTKLETKLDKMSERIDRLAEQHHADMMTLQRDIVGLHDRVARVEKQ